MSTAPSTPRTAPFLEGNAALIGTARGDRLAFEQLYAVYATRVFGLALAVIGDRAMAQDVTQEVFLEAWGKAGRFDPARGSATGWITTLTRSRAIDGVRRAQRGRARDTTWARRHTDREVDTVTETVLAGLEHRQVRTAMATLSPVQRQALTLTYFRGMSTTEVSDALSVPVSTIKTRCRDGLIKLRTEMCRSP